MEETTRYYPVALSVAGRRCVVVGGGAVGTRKALALLEAEADVVVNALTLSDTLQERVTAGRIVHLDAPFMDTMLDGAFLCIAATDSPHVNRQVAGAARERGVLLNLAAPTTESATDAESGDFLTMATVRRGDLLLALTTGGAGPALSARLRRELETQFGPEWSLYTQLLREMRVKIKTQIADEPQRAAALRRLADNTEIYRRIVAGDPEGAQQEAESCLSV